MNQIDTTFPVRFAETDAMGIVHHSNHLVWFEAGRVAFFRANGLDYQEWAGEDAQLAMVEVHVKYRLAAKFGQEVKVSTSLTRLKTRSITFEYTVSDRANDRVLATGSTRLICVDGSGKAISLPQNMYNQLAPIANE
ncbi:MAG: thioesterase family protein [Chloroflexota bacterium]